MSAINFIKCFAAVIRRNVSGAELAFGPKFRRVSGTLRNVSGAEIWLILLLIWLILLSAPASAQTRSLLFEDTFDRADSALGGVGNGWSDSGTRYSVAGGRLTALPIASPLAHSRITRPASEAVRDVAVEFVTEPWSTGSGPTYRACVRHINGANFYMIDVSMGTSGASGSLAIKKMVAGGTVNIASVPFSLTAGLRYRATLQATGISPTTLQATISAIAEDGSVVGSPITSAAVDSQSALQASGTTSIGLGWWKTGPASTGIGAIEEFRVWSVGGGNQGPPSAFEPNDPRVFFSPYNWSVTGTVARTGLAGAYLKTGFYGTSFRIAVDTSGMSSIPADNFPRIAVSIDNKPFVVSQLFPGQTELVAGQGLPDGPHQLFAYVYLNSQSSDLWGTTTTPPVNQWRITGFLADSGSTLIAPPVRPRRLLVYADSIGRSAYDIPGGSDADSLRTYVAGLAGALDAEYGVIAHAGQGWDAAVGGGSNVPTFAQAWDKLDASTGVDFSTPPDYLLVNHGRNGGVSPTAVVTVLTGLRAKAGPGAKLLLVIPFAGTNRANLVSGFSAYQGASGDQQAHRIDLGTDAWFSGATIYTSDGIHPNRWAHGLLAALLAGKVTGL